ncbi:sulfotransferase family 2 domain-containing protein [Falsiroseomonas sp. HW251]|uniref:sulfotransferase family 2 domain-containing protein n=1 Tax=Falsiroseomonas sp. HW251 TaxID=3390998 RepID=UPI003D32050E
MAAISHRLRVVYLPVPKNACTSIKSMLFEVESGRSVSSLRNREGKPVHVHAVYPSMPDGGVIPDGIFDYDVVAVLRDPVKRFVSGYRNRIQQIRDIERAVARDPRIAAAVEAKGLVTVPDIDSFAERLADYMDAVPVVKHHFLSQMAYVGKAVGRLSLVVGMDGLHRIAVLLAERAGQDVRMPHKQISRVAGEVAPCPATVDRLRAFYAEDYALLDRFGIAAG